MKIGKHQIFAGEAGSVEMTPVNSDDLWITYNLIAPGDTVKAMTVRKVIRESMVSGRDITQRVQIKLEIKVEEFADYDKVASVLRVRGKNLSPNEHVKIGSYHTLELEVQRPFVLTKKAWDTLALEEIKQASEPDASADLAVVLMQEGLAHILLVSNNLTVTCSRIEASIPRKHGPSVAGYESNLRKFFEKVVQAFLKHIDFTLVQCAVIASPGFTKDQFHKHLMLEAERKQLRPLIENKSRIILVHSNSGYKHSLSDVLGAPSIVKMIKDTKAAQQVKALKDFHDMMSKEQDRACYGPKHVDVAHERMAVQTLLITDQLFRNANVVVRQKYVDLVKSVKDSGGTTHIFSTLHVSGEELSQITGIAAILRFPLPDLDDIEMW